MNWLADICLQDLDGAQLLESTCPRCTFVHVMRVDEVTPLMPHPDLYLDEVAAQLHCRRPGCGHSGLRLTLIRGRETSSFVAGMP